MEIYILASKIVFIIQKSIFEMACQQDDSCNRSWKMCNFEGAMILFQGLIFCQAQKKIQFRFQISLVLIFILAVIIYRTVVSIPLFNNEFFRPMAQVIASMSGAVVNLIFIMILGNYIVEKSKVSIQYFV